MCKVTKQQVNENCLKEIMSDLSEVFEILHNLNRHLFILTAWVILSKIVNAEDKEKEMEIFEKHILPMWEKTNLDMFIDAYNFVKNSIKEVENGLDLFYNKENKKVIIN